MFDTKKLCEFLVEAKKSTYASGDRADKISEQDKSTTLVFEKGDWRYHDNYFGGEPYGGREVVLFKGDPVYIMTYYGWVNKGTANVEDVYKTLQQALFEISKSHPYRGPEKYTQGNYDYLNSFIGEIDNFYGEEVIKSEGKDLYKARYMGGLVDQKQ